METLYRITESSCKCTERRHLMGDYSRFISEKRRSVPTPESLVGPDGRCVFGTFDKEFKDMDLLRAKRPTGAPDFLNSKKLTLWEACEVHLEQGLLLSVVCDMGIFGLNLNVFYDKRSQKVYQWQTNVASKEAVIAPNLLDGNMAEVLHKNGYIRYINDFQIGKCRLYGSHKNKKGDFIEYDFDLTRISKPSIVSIPFGENRPLYSQKDFLIPKGYLIINGERMETTDTSAAIIDDHRGYYPRRMHYDWVTTMGRSLNGEEKYFAFNLTRNQSRNQKDYNENLIWKEGEISLLPPVSFKRNVPTKKFSGRAAWLVEDKHDMVRLKFHLKNIFRMEIHAAVVKIEYYITFGELEGYLRDENGEKIILDGLTGMGEDKTMLF